MKLSTILNNLSRELEVHTAKAIVSLIEEQGWNKLEWAEEGGGWDMSFYSHTMVAVVLENDTWVVKAISKDDPNGALIDHDLFDHGVLPLPDLLIILEEVERQIETYEESGSE